MGVEVAKPSIGSTMHVCASLPATYDASGYNALAWIAVGLVTDVPEIGDEAAEITASDLATGRVVHFNGEKKGASGDVMIIHDPTDAGQIILKNGAGTSTVHSFKFTNAAGLKSNFIGVIAAYRETPKSTATFEGRRCVIRGNSPIVYV